MKAPSAVRSMSDVSNSLNQQQVLKSKKNIFHNPNHLILFTFKYLGIVCAKGSIAFGTKFAGYQGLQA